MSFQIRTTWDSRPSPGIPGLVSPDSASGTWIPIPRYSVPKINPEVELRIWRISSEVPFWKKSYFWRNGREWMKFFFHVFLTSMNSYSYWGKKKESPICNRSCQNYMKWCWDHWNEKKISLQVTASLSWLVRQIT